MRNDLSLLQERRGGPLEETTRALYIPTRSHAAARCTFRSPIFWYTTKINMSVQRSPTRSGPIVSRSDSFPNLTKKSNPSDSSDTSQITFRNKRKLSNESEQLYDLRKDFTEMRTQMTAMQSQMTEMMAYLTSTNATQSDNFTKISEDMSVIKEQLKDIKSTTEYLTEEQNKLKTDLLSIQKSNITLQNRIEKLESSIREYDHNTSSTETGTKMETCENIITELNERSFRSRNLLISGIPEATSTDQMDRQIEDKNSSWKILRNINPDCPEPIKVFRVGKRHPDKIRPVKVCFGTQEPAIYILRNKSKLKNYDNKIFSDQTPKQQAYMKCLKEELEARSKRGETNLIIKYVKGIPKIISQQSKNLYIH